MQLRDSLIQQWYKPAFQLVVDFDATAEDVVVPALDGEGVVGDGSGYGGLSAEVG